jgi:catechol 2,3-dioxygenase-like lactoylglutathione lyase family enzyme
MKRFGGIQQIGIGVEHAGKAWDWYRSKLGFDIPLIDDSGVAAAMLPYTGGKAWNRRAILAVNLEGGGGLEIWQYADRKPKPPAFEPRIGDLGLFAIKLRAADVGAASRRLGENASSVLLDPRKVEHFFIRDPFGNIFQAVACRDRFCKTKAATGGVSGAMIGVSDMDVSLSFYKDVFGYDVKLYDVEGVFEDLRSLPGGDGSFRRALIARSSAPTGPFSELLGAGEIELFQARDQDPRKLFEGRFWGDLGLIQLCFDVQGLGEFKRDCAAMGHPFTVDSNPELDLGPDGTESFAMGEASGRFAYLEDPDGTLIELVETHRIPILAKIGWYLNLRASKANGPLPRWILKLLRLGRRSD